MMTGSEGENKASDSRRRSGKSGPKSSPYIALAMAMDLGLTVGGAALIGWWLDGYFQTRPVLTLILSGAAIIGGFVRLLQLGRRFNR